MHSIWKAMFGRLREEREMSEEMASHIENRSADLMKAGLPRNEAVRLARLEFGNIENYKESCRDARGFRLLDELLQDLRYAFRMMRRTPAVTVVAVLSLAMGIGANTAVYSLLNALLLRTLPVQQPQRLVVLREESSEGPGGASSYPLFLRMRSGLAGKVLEDVAATSLPGASNITIPGGDSIRVVTEDVSANYFTFLRVSLVAGANFGPHEDKIGAAPVAIIGERLWKSRFAGSSSVIGKLLVVNDRPVRVIGIAPAEFSGMQVDTAVDLWMNVTANDPPAYLTRRGFAFLQLFGRLRPGFTVAQADAAARTIFNLDQKEAYSQLPAKKRGVVSQRRMSVETGDTGFSMLRQQFSLPLRIVMVIVAMILLIVCANIANLLLARMATRRREVSTRISLGAGAGRLVRQFLTEASLLAGMGALIGIALAWWGDLVLVQLLPSGEVPIILDVHPDARVLLFSAAISLGSVVIFGIAPALRVLRLDVTAGLKVDPGANVGQLSRPSLGKLLVVAQVALSMVLLFGAALLVRTLINLRNVDAGFHPQHVVTFGLSLPRAYSRAQQATVSENFVKTLRTEVGITGVSAAWPGAFTDGRWDGTFEIVGQSEDDTKKANLLAIDTDFFSVLRIPMLAGRDFAPQDRAGTPNVVVINKAMAMSYFQGQYPVGQKIFGQASATEASPATVIGVVHNARHWGLRAKPVPTIYFPITQVPPRWAPEFLLRTNMGLTQATAAIRDATATVNGQLRLDVVHTLDEKVNNYLERERLLASISGAFGLLALTLAAAGVYGVISYGVTRRTSEIGLRMALGADRSQVLSMIVREAAIIPLVGVAVAIPAAIAMSHVAESVLFGVKPGDMWSLVGSGIIMLAIAMVAASIPARRAVRIDPISVLRHE
jgi:predicted permease